MRTRSPKMLTSVAVQGTPVWLQCVRAFVCVFVCVCLCLCLYVCRLPWSSLDRFDVVWRFVLPVL